MKVEFHELRFEGVTDVISVQLAPVDGESLLCYRASDQVQPVVSLVPLQGGPAKPRLVATLRGPGTPQWDAAAVGGSSFYIVSTEAGSAVSGLLWHNTSRAESERVNRLDAFGVFGSPHFVKGDPQSITSVALLDGRTPLVLFTREADGAFGKYRQLERPGAGTLLDARLIRSAQGYWLFTKTADPDGGASRSDGFGDTILPGVLECVALDAGYRMTGVAVRPLGDRAILEFDADIHGDDIAIFATTAEGYTVAAGRVSNGKFQPAALPAQTHAQPLTSPSIVSIGPRLHFAAVESVRTPATKVLVATAP